MGLHLSELELQNILKKGHVKINRNNVQSSTPDLECSACDEIKKPYEDQAFDKRVIITVHSFRHREADPDGLCAKYHIDAIVDSGLLIDDKTKYVKEVRHKQSKIPKTEDEKTIITLKEIEDCT